MISISETKLISIITDTINEIVGNDKNKSNPLSRQEILLFKELNRNKKELGDKRSMLLFINDFLRLIGLPREQALFYYEIYTQNYRPEGDYENITHNNFKNIRDLKSKKITNSKSSEYVSSKIPFTGSNLEGLWEVNNSNKWQYVVKSYGWYPIYLFVDDKWYEVSDRYSPTTGKQMGQSRPFRYSRNVNDKVYSVTREEMGRLVRGESIEDIEPDRVNKFIDRFKTFYPNSVLSLTIGNWNNKKRVKIRIDRVSKVGGKVKFKITILKTNRVVNRRSVENPDGALIDLNNIDEIKTEITNRIVDDNSDFLSHDNTIFNIIPIG